MLIILHFNAKSNATFFSVATSQYIWIADMENIMKAQSLTLFDHDLHVSQKISLNPDHPIMENLSQKAESNKNDKSIKNLMMLLFETVLMSSARLKDLQND